MAKRPSFPGVASLAWLLGTSVANAAEPRPAEQPSNAPTPPAAGPRADAARGYAEPPGTEPEDVALFVPRALLWLPRFALKIVFFPIVETVGFLDKHAVIENVKDVLYNDARTAGIVPVLSADTFFGPTFGMRAFHDDLAGHSEHASVEARFGGRYEQAYQIEFQADRVGGSRLWLETLTRFEIEPALLFQGIGMPPERSSGVDVAPRDAAIATRFREQRLLNLLRTGYTVGHPGALTKLGAIGVFNQRKFDRPNRANDPATEGVYDTSLLPGYEEGASTLELDASLVVDSRDVGGATSSGVYFEAFGGGVLPIGEYGFWHHGFEATGYIDLYAKTRVLVVRTTLEGVEGDTPEIPFAELPRIGGPYRLRGYPLDRFRDEKAAVATLEYHYPIHQYIAGSLHLDAGRVAPNYRELFDSDDVKFGVGGGFVFRSRDSLLFTVDMAYGESFQLYLTTDPLRAFATRDTEL